jgi:hypothetical protein
MSMSLSQSFAPERQVVLAFSFYVEDVASRIREQRAAG